MRQHEWDASIKRRRESEAAVAAAQELRHRAIQGTYAGLSGEGAGLAMASLMEAVSRCLEVQPTEVRNELAEVVRLITDGPDGPLDPRGKGGMPPLSAGPGH